MESLLPFLPPFIFMAVWFAVTTLLRKMARMTRHLDVDTGFLVRASRWGSASINGVRCRNCAKIEEYDDGYLLRTMWIFGGGKLWLPRTLIQVGELREGDFRFSRSRALICEGNQVILYDRLADFFAPTSNQ